MKTKISVFFTTIALLLLGTTTAAAQGTNAYFKKNGATVFQSPISDIDSIVFMPLWGSYEYEFFTNPNDPYFLKATNKDGTEIIISGDKDENGTLLDVTNIKITKGNNEYNVVYSNGQVVKIYDNSNNVTFINYDDVNETATASVIPQNSDTIYHLQIARTNNTLSKSFVKEKLRTTNINNKLRATNTNDGYYYLRYKIKLEFVGIAPNSTFSENYYTHKVIIYDDVINYEKNAERIEIGNDYVIYQLKLNPNYENEPLQNTLSASIDKVLDIMDIGSFTLGDILSSIATAYLGEKLNIDEFAQEALGDVIGKFVDSLINYEINPNDLPKAIHTDRKIGDGYKIAVYVTGTGINSQTQIEQIDYTDLKQQQDKDIHLEVTLKNIFPFEETFMYGTDDTCESFDNPEGVVINGVRWATRNVGAPGTFASSPCDPGMFYQWNKGTTNFLLYNDYNNTNYGYSDYWLPANDPSPAGWHVPTISEIQALLDNSKVSNEWISVNGVNGRKFTDNATGNSIFLSAAGYRGRDDGTLYYASSYGAYWISPVLGDNHWGAYIMGISSDGTDYCAWGIDSARGQSVRAVAE